MTALTQWIAMNIPDGDQLNGIYVGQLGGRPYDLTDLLDIWQPDWRSYTQQHLSSILNPAFDPDAPCPHADFEAGVSVQRIVGDDMAPVAYMAEIQVACTVCDERWRWSGVKPGLSYIEPMMSADGLTLLAPFRPASADEDFGMGLPGFNVNLIGPELGHERTAAAVRRRALRDAAASVKARVVPTNSIAANRVLRHAAMELDRMAEKEADDG